jgi:hypothetical protein
MIVDSANIIKATKTPEVSPSIGPLTTQATLGTIAQNVVQSDLAPAATKGYTTIETPQGAETYIGQYALTPKQLENAGIIKPGSSSLVQSLLSSGNDISQAMPPAIFTGKSGAKDYNSFVRNIPAQSNAVVKNLQVAQTALQNSGLITGAEAPSEINGVVLSAANNGVDSVLGTIKSNRDLNGTLIQRQPIGLLDETQKDIEAGNYAGKLAESGLGTLGGVETALQSLAKNPNSSSLVSTGRGLQADAYETIKNSIPNLKPNQPNDLIELQKLKALQVSDASLGSSSNELSQQIQGRLTGTTRLPQGISSVGQSLMNLANVPLSSSTSMDSGAELPDILSNPFTGTSLKDFATATNTGSLATTAASLAAGLNNLPGSLGSVASITDFSKGNAPELPGTADLQAELKNLSADAMNNIQTQGLSILNNASGVNGLVDMVSSKLPAGAASLLQNALGSISAAGLGLKSPSAGVNTVPDRKTIAAELRNAMNDAAIPEPNYIGVSEQASGKIEKTTEERKEFIVKQKELKEKFKKKNEEFMAAYTAHGLAENTLPQGSSIVASLKAKYEAKAAERNAIKKQLDDLYKEFPEFAIRNTADTSKNSTSQTTGRPGTVR